MISNGWLKKGKRKKWKKGKSDFKVTILFNVKNSKMVKDRAIFTMADQ